MNTNTNGNGNRIRKKYKYLYLYEKKLFAFKSSIPNGRIYNLLFYLPSNRVKWFFICMAFSFSLHAISNFFCILWVLTKSFQTFTCLLEGEYWIPLSSTELIRRKHFFCGNSHNRSKYAEEMCWTRSSKNTMPSEQKRFRMKIMK